MTTPEGNAPDAPQNPPPAPSYAAPPAYATPPVYPGTSQPGYGTTPAYPMAPGYGGSPAGPGTNTLAIVSLVSSLVGVLFLPLIGQIVGVITGHMSLNQLKTSGEKGRGLALAGTIVGWVSLGLAILGFILFFAIFLPVIVQNGVRYSS